MTDFFENARLRPAGLENTALYGELERQLESVMRYYYSIPNDDLLKPYRQRRGLPAPGKPMGGVYVSHSPFGQYLSAYARFYRATGEEKYKAKAVYLMDEWGRTIEEDGFFFDTRKPFLSCYYYDKLVCGLVDIANLCGEKRALDYLARITDWEQEHVPETRKYCDTVGQDTGEWYTQSENLYKAWLVSGDERYKMYASKWEYSEYWNEILNRDYENMYRKSPWHHAYSHVNTFSGAGMAYIVTGSEIYLDILKAAYEFLQNEQCYATGGFGSGENLAPRSVVAEQLQTANHHFETQCGSWAGFKLSKYLTCFTGEARYSDWVERLILNCIGASLPNTGEGRVFYHSEYRTCGAHKRHYHASPWPCCTGTRPQAVCEYKDLLYFTDGDSIYVAQYFASEARLQVKGQEVTVSQKDSAFPAEPRTVICIGADCGFALKFRIPGWAAARPEVRINGKKRAWKKDGDWGVISRTWEKGDRVEITLPMEFEARYLFDDPSLPYAVTYGPLAMAFRGGVDVNPALFVEPGELAGDFEPMPCEELTWRRRDNHDIVMKPFFMYKENEEYFLYLDKKAGISLSSYRLAELEGQWRRLESIACSEDGDARCSFRFRGRGIRLRYFGRLAGGVGRVCIDGKAAGEIDFYNESNDIALFRDFYAEDEG
ncbi:MAG: glycoside hydrolase family 127 protein, partial [Abditibacteriota bacterium]|nr:glycoside hydrolase family 127 protein [Abditibacteriota bacterium]